MKYSVCASSVYRGQPLKHSLPLLKVAGATAYEFWLWWEEDQKELKALQDSLGLQLVSVCSRFAPMNVPERQKEFLEGLRETLDFAEELGCPFIIGQAGPQLSDVPRDEQEKRIADTLVKADALLAGSRCTLALEPLNTQIDHKGYFLDRAGDAFRLARAAGSPRVRVLYDIYHQFITEGAPLTDLLDNLDLVCHVHLAGHPGRHEPWLENRIRADEYLDALQQAGYTGYVGLEYMPKDPDRAQAELAGFLKGRCA